MKEILAERLNFYRQLIPEIYPGRFPCGFRLSPRDWIIDSEVIARPLLPAEVMGENRLIRQIATMDVEFLSNDIVYRARAGTVDLIKHYPCGLKCPGCFSEESIFGDGQNLMTWEEVMAVIDEARSIGLTSIKFLGPGELFQNPDLFDILNACEERNLPISIFTKGAELGNDELARRVFESKGICSAKQLVGRIAQYECVRILLGFNSLFTQRQDAMVGSRPLATYQYKDGVYYDRGIADYTAKRDCALKNLVDAGFNDPTRGQRLTLVMAPLQKIQVDEVAEVYEWSARRNIPTVIAPTMESGPKAQGLVRILTEKDPGNDWLYEAYERVYGRAFSLGILNPASVVERGLSPYLGTEACNQVANGLMLRLNGQVKICPGSSRPSHLYGSVRNADGTLNPKKIIEIWVNSPNYRYGAVENNWCPAKSTMLPMRLKTEIELKFLRMSGMEAAVTSCCNTPRF